MSGQAGRLVGSGVLRAAPRVFVFPPEGLDHTNTHRLSDRSDPKGVRSRPKPHSLNAVISMTNR